ncbi:MAG: aminoacyl-tRNA hydrolase [Candidatus Moranbacteria bacterium]|nr:aminoacyl-tRNA hydrolase [Candidatus Moranbacteria bacterium]
MKKILIAGLGNPGKKYARTRHNAGFLFADYFWEDNQENFSGWEFSKKINGDISAGKIDSMKIILLKPQTFMNLSGEAILAAKKYFKIKLEDIFVVHDEIDLPLGSFRFSKDSSAAGHKGVQSIIDALGTKNFTRLRIGVDNRGEKKIATEKYVLGKFIANELGTTKDVFEKSTVELLKYIS